VTYKVFLVEDEITTREGIRDNVDWQAMGFELCGEAPDGEIALPQIEIAQPDVLITDIKMPFMDGLQLCKIIREHMPWMKIVIISGHNDFHFAQTAIKLGVTEYLLKPVSVQDLHAVFARIAVMLDQEKSERVYLKKLSRQVEDNFALLREKFLLRLVTGGESSISAIEQSQQLGLNIISPYYQVILFEARPADSTQLLAYPTCQQVEKVIMETIVSNPDMLLTKKDLEEYVLVLKGESLEQLQQEGPFLADLVQKEVERQTTCRLFAGIGRPQPRLGDLHRSFTEALVNLKLARDDGGSPSDVKKLDHTALRDYLENVPASGHAMSRYDPFFDQSLRPLVEAALRSPLLKHYLLLDVLLTIAQYISDFGGDPGKILPDRVSAEALFRKLHTADDVQAESYQWFLAALTFVEAHSISDRAAIIQQAQKYIARHFSDSSLSLNEVAAQVNFSPNHFSAVFSAETGITFREHLTRIRLAQAQKMLRTTRLKCAEIALQCGYNDPHYFSLIFRKNFEVTPQQYRDSARNRQSRLTLPGEQDEY
jgi:two-component system, response regulator YesN